MGSVLASRKASAASAWPTTLASSIAFTMPSTRLTSVPDAMSSELRPRFLRSAASISSSTAAILVMVISVDVSSLLLVPRPTGWVGSSG